MDDAEFLVRELRRGGFDPSYERVDNARAMEAALQRQAWDIVISDYSMPGFTGLDALNLTRAKDVEMPFILVSGTVGEHVAVGAMKAGAHDYLMKNNLTRLAPAVARELREAKIRRDQKAALKAWQQELESHVQERTAQLTLAHEQLQAEVAERRRLESEIARAVEREQQRLGQELHDGLGQELTGIAYLVAALRNRLAKLNPSCAREAKRLEAMILRAVDETRMLAKGFYPVELQQYGLSAGLEELARLVQQSFDIPCVVQADEIPRDEICNSVTVQLFRIAQEAVHNAVKHAKTKQILIRLAKSQSDIVLTISDDGVGLPPDIEDSKGMGLHIMKHRAHLINATFDLRNDAASGAVVTCSVPAASLKDSVA